MRLRRAPIVLGATLAGLAGVLSYQPHSKLAGRPVSPPGIVASAPAPRSTSSRQPARPAARTVTIVGNDIPNEYGDVQVRIKASGTKIVSVDAAVLPSGDSRSQEISTVAGPLLSRQALAAQSAQIDGVSGASYTSDGYRRSLQSALDRLASTSSQTGTA
jgi:uncharacterized protein with FMN-binding domain